MAINDLLSSSTWKPARAVVDDVIINVELVWVPIILIITQAGASRSSVGNPHQQPVSVVEHQVQ